MKPVGRIGVAQLDKVSDLINNYTGSWSMEVARQKFLHTDAEAILNIPLNPAGGDDLIAWALEKSGDS